MNRIRGAWRSIAATAVAAAVAFGSMQVANAEPKQDEFKTDAPGYLDWAIRSSFNNYIGGPTYVKNGAKWEKGSFSFPLKEKKWDAANKRLEVQYEGSVQYRGYCKNGQDKFDLKVSCDLDLVMKDPKVILDDDPGQSQIEATVSSKQYPGGGTYNPQKPVPIVKLETRAANVDKTDKGWQWTDVTTSLTADGLKMFSNFYHTNEALNPVTFSFNDEGPEAPKRGFGDLFYGAKWQSAAEYDKTHHILNGPILANGKRGIIVAAAEKGAYLLDDELKQIDFLQADLPQHGAVHFNEKTNELLYGEYQKDNLNIVKVTASGFETPRSENVNGQVMAISSNQDGKAVAVVHSFGQSSQPHDAYLAIVESGSVRTEKLRDTKELMNRELSQHSETLYGPTYGKRDPLDIFPLADGTFVYDPKTDITMQDGTRQKYLLLHIDPSGTDGKYAKVMEGSQVHNGGTIESLAVSNDGKKLLRYNIFDKEHSRVQISNYANGKLTHEVELSKLNDITSLSNAAFDGDTPVFYSSNTAMLQWRDKNGKITEKFPIPYGFKTKDNIHGRFLVREDGIFLPTMFNGAGDYKEYFQVRKIGKEQDSTKPPLPKPDDRDNTKISNVPFGEGTLSFFLGFLRGLVTFLPTLVKFFKNLFA